MILTGDRDRRNPRTEVAVVAPQDATTGQLDIIVAVSTDSDYDALSRPQFRRRVLDVDVGPEGKVR